MFDFTNGFVHYLSRMWYYGCTVTVDLGQNQLYIAVRRNGVAWSYQWGCRKVPAKYATFSNLPTKIRRIGCFNVYTGVSGS